ncbi:MAG: thiamine pyrophosphate-dependent dehydrogenase E1 component subunit alpha [Planctomycetota bacterium]|jgi:2-oxoisovalerate dehydrogenase E1 component alpha subunit|nr:thiamine pyrophosphate-dependent dehydrogenase E1 component subunit alpha [Planctomycetota bacterium]
MSGATQDLLQVISEGGKALKGKKSGLSEELLLGMYRSMVQTRLLDERMINLQRQGRIGFYVPSTGEEASQVGSALAFEEEDWIYPSYRVPGLFLQRGVPIERMVANCFGNDADLCLGRQMPVHYAFKDQNIVSISSPIGTHIVQATGTAMAQKIKGSSGVTAVMFGDGGTSSNDFHSGMNLAGVTRAPCVFICTNNQWAISVPQEKQTASKSFAIKAKAYGMPGVRVDGNDVLAVYKATKSAVDDARAGKGPTLLELVTYRRGPHSSSDDPTRYRGNQADEWMDKDPILRFRKYLENQDLWSEVQENALHEELKAGINASVKVAENAPQPALETLFTDVFEKVPPYLREQYETLVQDEGTGHEPDPDAAFPL